VLAERGHRVTLCEKNNSLGGNLIPGSVPHFKRYDRALVKWYQRQLELLGVEVKMNCEVKVENISEYKPDEIITATGSKDLDIPVHNIGDSQKVHNIMYSIWNSYELAREL